jgi:hypothetical protein
MTTIDHRILVPVPQHAVWDYIRKLTNNAKWQVDCKGVSMLTTMQEGVGTRWRAESEGGRDYVVEIRAWYDGLGYEYTFVDRPPFRDVVGRIRLQEIPEGTVVQWTLSYELGGVLGGLRNSLGAARSIDNAIQQSLKKLYLQLKTDRARVITTTANKSTMRDAPDADARAAYKPRHPSALEDDEAVIAAPPLSLADEPAIVESDTRPTKAVTVVTDEQIANAAPQTEAAQEPDFVASIPVWDGAPDSTAPSRSDLMGEAQLIDLEAVQRELEVPSEPVDDNKRSTAEIARVAAQVPAAPPLAPSPITMIPEPALTDSQRLFDTSKMSIWEVFGVPRPSETQEMAAVQLQAAAPPVTVTAPAPVASNPIAANPVATSHSADPVAQPRTGLRAKMRRRSVKLRRVD